MKIRLFKYLVIILFLACVVILLVFYIKTSSTDTPSSNERKKQSHLHDEKKEQAETLSPTIKMQIHYQGRTFLVDSIHPDYNADQANEINAIITNVKPPELFQSYKSMMDFYREFKCPGFGGSTGGFGEKTTLGQFTFISVEIPKRQRFRTLIYCRTGDQKPYQLFDDFYYNGHFAPLLMFVAEGKRVTYLHQSNGNVIRTKDIL